MFKNTFIHISYASLLLGCFAAVGWSDTLVQVTSQAGQGSNDSIVWSQLGADQTVLATSFTVNTANGALVRVALAGPSSIVSVVCGTVAADSKKSPSTTGGTCSWTGGTGGSSPFTGGDTLLWAANSANGGNGPVILTFGTAISGGGALIQANVPGTFTAQITAFNGSTNLGSFTVNSDSTGDPVYIGLKDSTGANVTSLQFSLTACGATALGSDDCNDFGIDTVYLNTIGTSTPGVVSANPNPATGASQNFALVYSDTSGFGSLNVVAVIFNPTVTAKNTCYVYYAPATNRLYLQNDAGTGATYITPGSGTLTNSQCMINGTNTNVVTSVDQLTLNLAVTATGSFEGPKTVFMYARDNTAANTGWVNKDTWTPSSSFVPSIVSASPNPASGTSVPFALTYSDSGGFGALTVVAVNFNSVHSSKNACYLYYVPQTNLLYLQNNNGQGATSITPGSGTLTNSQCTINGSSVSVNKSANNLTLNLTVNATANFTGTKSIFMYAADNSSANTGWVTEGRWTP